MEAGSPMLTSTTGCQFITTTGATAHLSRCMSWVSSTEQMLSHNALSAFPDAVNNITGHNLNLAHAGEGFVEYGDQSGMMVSQAADSFFGTPTSRSYF